MAYDDKVVHWELKDVINFNNKFFFRLNTIKLINNKYETALMPCDPLGKLTNLYIYFYNQHINQEDAEDFHKQALFQLQELTKNTSEEVKDLIYHIDENVTLLHMYRESVPYSYPEDILGETYR
jgi:hypothetical protein